MPNRLTNKLRQILGLRASYSVHEYGWLFFDHLKCDYRLVESSIQDERERAILNEIIEKREKRQLTWEDIRTFDLMILRHLPPEAIRGKILGLRQRFEKILTPTEFEQYKSSKKTDLDDISEKIKQNTINEGDINALKAEYSDLIREFCIRYSFMASKEGLRSLLLRWGGTLTFVFCIFVIILGYLIYGAATGNPNPLISKIISDQDLQYLSDAALLMMVILAGITGAFVSMQQRIQSADYRVDPILDLSFLTHGWLSIFLSPLSGAIFAVILYLCFAGNLISGSIFPTFTHPPKDNTQAEKNATSQDSNSTNSKTSSRTHPTDFFRTSVPESNKDIAVLLVWSFIAGFAERFVPDTLNRFVSKEEENKKS